MLYAHKNVLVHINEIKDDGRLLTTVGEIPVLKGDFTITFADGTTRLIDKQELEDYLPVEKVRKHKFTEDEIAKNYSQDWSMMEEQDYIETFQENVRKRNKLED